MDQEQQREVTSRVRRKLLKIAVYTPPAIIGTLFISRDAMAQVSPCQPDRPCKPAPCSPQPCKPAPCGPYP